MPLLDVSDWLDWYSGPRYVWYVKRLSGNDTLANGSHQAGPYIPKEFLFRVLPALHCPDVLNPDVRFNLYIDSHADHRTARAVWYNNRLHNNPSSGRNEARLTNLGGASSALLDPESTGALVAFAFSVGGDDGECHVWVCRHGTEEDQVEDRIGPVPPGKWAVLDFDQSPIPNLLESGLTPTASCWMSAGSIPPAWLERFPSGEEVIRKAVELRRLAGLTPDKRLLKRRECEFAIFRSVEEAVELPIIQRGFSSVDTFAARALTILQRRKSRSGRSLELHTRQIFLEEGLTEGADFEHQPESDPARRPDFLFPSGAHYRDPAFPTARLRMLAVKTTCRDRWRQILNEADRIPRKHLLTLQEGISVNQFREMTSAGVQLVVPDPLMDTFPDDVRPHLQALESFIADVRLLLL